jgi:beta-lactamase regulating signal transducer with metallopeptidase domain
MTIWWWVAQHCATTAALVAVVALVCRMIPTRPALQHALWLVVLLKFLLPPVVVWPVAAPDFESLLLAHRADEHAPPIDIDTTDISLGQAPRPDIESRVALPPSVTLRDDEPESQQSASTARTAATIADFAVAEKSHDATAPAADISADAAYESSSAAVARALRSLRGTLRPDRLLWTAWLVGSCVVAVRHWRRITRYARLARGAVAAPDYLTAEGVRLAREFGVRPIPLLIADEISSPFVWCLGRLKLIWPASLADETEFARWQGIMAHELAHVRRGDHWTAWLELVAGIVWWWNPLYLFTRRRLREAAEIACDALAVGMLPDGRRAYAEAFLELSLPQRCSEPAPALGVRSRDHKSFERRLSMILSQRVVGKISSPGLVAVAVLSIVAAPSWTRGQVDRASTPTAPTSDATAPASDVVLVTAIADEPGDANSDDQPVGPQPSASPTINAQAADSSSAVASEPKIEITVGNSSEIARPTKTIARAQIADLAIATVTQVTMHKVEITGRKLGSTRLNLWDENDRLDSIVVVVQVDTTKPLETFAVVGQQGSNYQGILSAARGSTLQPAANGSSTDLSAQRPAVAKRSQPAPSAKTATVATAAIGSVEQFDVTKLGIALIEARGDVELAENQVSILVKIYERVGTNTSDMEIKAAKIKLLTATQKVNFLTKIAQSAYDEEMRDLGDQRKLVSRTKTLAEHRAISMQQIEEAQRQLNAAAARLKAIEAFPGIKVDGTGSEPVGTQR